MQTRDTPIRLIAVDIDGTLLDGRGNLPARNRRAVRRAIAGGIHVVLVTGRAFHHATPIAVALSVTDTPGAGPPRAGRRGRAGRRAAADDLALIVSNGALTKRTDGTTLDSRLVPRETARAIVTAMRPRHPGVAVIFDRPDARQYVYESIDWSHPQRSWYYERNRAFITRVEPIDAALTEDPVQVAFTGGVAQMRALDAEVRRLPEAAGVTMMLTEYAARDFSLLDIIAGGWSKGGRAGGVDAAPGARPLGSDGGGRQPERPRDAGVRRPAGGHGECRRAAQGVRLADDRDPRRVRPRGRDRGGVGMTPRVNRRATACHRRSRRPGRW